MPETRQTCPGGRRRRRTQRADGRESQGGENPAVTSPAGDEPGGTPQSNQDLFGSRPALAVNAAHTPAGIAETRKPRARAPTRW